MATHCGFVSLNPAPNLQYTLWWGSDLPESFPALLVIRGEGNPLQPLRRRLDLISDRGRAVQWAKIDLAIIECLILGSDTSHFDQLYIFHGKSGKGEGAGNPGLVKRRSDKPPRPFPFEIREGLDAGSLRRGNGPGGLPIGQVYHPERLRTPVQRREVKFPLGSEKPVNGKAQIRIAQFYIQVSGWCPFPQEAISSVFRIF